MVVLVAVAVVVVALAAAVEEWQRHGIGLAASRGESRTWRYLAGTHLPCWLLEAEASPQGRGTEHRCLALAGYDGRRVVVAWTPWQ
ncbi:hypothetical protein AK812_SmicGene45858, partial [Symbiodinium microadriaticum]